MREAHRKGTIEKKNERKNPLERFLPNYLLKTKNYITDLYFSLLNFFSILQLGNNFMKPIFSKNQLFWCFLLQLKMIKNLNLAENPDFNPLMRYETRRYVLSCWFFKPWLNENLDFLRAKFFLFRTQISVQK